MTDIVLESIRALIVAVIFLLLCLSGRDRVIRRQHGWSYIVAGFGLVLFGMVIDITDNFSSLNKYIIIGDTEYQAFIEKVIGYLFGFFLLAVGFWKWLPVVLRLKGAELALKEANGLLELNAKEHAAQPEKGNQERKQTEANKEKLVTELQKTLDEVKTLKGILPICSFCRKIRDDKGYWNQVEDYIVKHLKVEFSHSFCPECAEKHYPKFVKNKNELSQQ